MNTEQKEKPIMFITFGSGQYLGMFKDSYCIVDSREEAFEITKGKFAFDYKGQEELDRQIRMFGLKEVSKEQVRSARMSLEEEASRIAKGDNL